MKRRSFVPMLAAGVAAAPAQAQQPSPVGLPLSDERLRALQPILERRNKGPLRRLRDFPLADEVEPG